LMETTIENKRDYVSTRSSTVKCYSEQPFPIYLDSVDLLSSTYHLRKETVQKVILVLQRIIEACQIFGLCDCPYTRASYTVVKGRVFSKVQLGNIRSLMGCFNKHVHTYCDLVARMGEHSWVPIFKWKFAAFFSFYRLQEIPPCPFEGYNKRTRRVLSPHTLMGGMVHDWMGMLKAYQPEDFFVLADTVLQLKKVMPRVDQELVDLSIQQTVESLTTERVTWEPGPEEIFDLDIPCELFTRKNLEQEIDRTVEELFSHTRLDPESWVEPFFPSTSANYIRSRKNGGAVGEIVGDPDFTPYLGGESSLNLGVKLVSLYEPKSWHYGKYAQSEEIHYQQQADLGQPVCEQVPTLVIDDTDYKKRWENFYWKVFGKSRMELPYVTPVGLCEPLKVRVITKGPPYLYTALKPMQRFLWRQLKNHRVFSLIGRYVTPCDIDDMMSLNKLHLMEVKLLSGDYKASTDNLHSWVSTKIVDKLMDVLEYNMSVEDDTSFPLYFMKDLREMMHTALTGHIFDFGDQKRNQRGGQLMGSIVSFPVLCIANAALCRYAMELSEAYDLRSIGPLVQRSQGLGYPTGCDLSLTDRDQKRRQAPLLVNGDDCLMCGTLTLKRVWEVLGRVMGLESSLGKTYWSSSFCTINSTIFERKAGEDGWVERKYVNLGLLHGLKRSMVSSSHEPTQNAGNLGTICRELKRSCPERYWPHVKRQFIRYNSEKLNLFSKAALPWFLPEWLGGAGLPRDGELISETDRKIASIIRKKYAEFITPPSVEAHWKMHQLVMKRIEEFGIQRTNFTKSDNGPLKESWEKAYKYLTVDLLLTSPFEKLIHGRHSQPDFHIKMNSRLWREARGILSSNIEPLDDDEIEYEKRDFYFPCVQEVITIVNSGNQGIC